MLNFDRKTLANGLKVILHYDEANPLASLNIHYLVGARDDPPHQTGMAHLFEHLMFSGTKQYPSYDLVIQNAGGENNAFTTCDNTNYHITLPSMNLATALALEADRMSHIRLTKTIFDREKQVVLEEYKETCLNKPYGDSFQLICQLAYKRHPYQWPTIGKNEEAIANLELEEAKQFYRKYYQPGNAILSITSNIPSDQLMTMVEKHFGAIKPGTAPHNKYLSERPQKKLRRLISKSKAPADALYMAFHIGSRMVREFYIADVISDILSNGHSTRLYRKLVRGKKMASTIDASITGSLDPGLFIIEAKAIPGKSIELLEKSIWDELESFKKNLVKISEFIKIKKT
ncbi:MAG: pitrilysin family protein, partial [Saprospiraceae bacterium]